MRPSSPSEYHSLRLASDRRWGSAYRKGRAAAVAQHGLGYGERDLDLADDGLEREMSGQPASPAPVDLTLWRPPRRREHTRQG